MSDEPKLEWKPRYRADGSEILQRPWINVIFEYEDGVKTIVSVDGLVFAENKSLNRAFKEYQVEMRKAQTRIPVELVENETEFSEV